MTPLQLDIDICPGGLDLIAQLYQAIENPQAPQKENKNDGKGKKQGKGHGA